MVKPKVNRRTEVSVGLEADTLAAFALVAYEAGSKHITIASNGQKLTLSRNQFETLCNLRRTILSDLKK